MEQTTIFTHKYEQANINPFQLQTNFKLNGSWCVRLRSGFDQSSMPGAMPSPLNKG